MSDEILDFHGPAPRGPDAKKWGITANKSVMKTVNPGPVAPPPQFIKPPPPKEAPVFVVPRMSNMPQEAYVPKVRRVVEAEIEEIAMRAQPFFKERYPRMTPEGTTTFLRSIINNNRWLFIRTAYSAGCAYVKQDVFEPLPVVVEFAIVSWSHSALGSGGIRIHREFIKWAESINAIEYWFGSANNTDLSAFAKRLGCEATNVQHVKKLPIQK